MFVKLVVVLSLALPMLAQAPADPNDPLTFEIASVKADTVGCPPNCGLVRPLPGMRQYHAEGATLRSLITIAYQVTDRQISGGPAWLGSDRFDLDAKASRPRSSDDLHAMLAHLLEERFHLTVRRENRQESVLALSQDKGGSKLPVHDPEDKDFPPIGNRMNRGADGLICPALDGKNVMMSYFAFFLSRTSDRAVIDRTGLSARYDIDMPFVPEGARLNGPDGQSVLSPDCPDLHAALAKLGLKLEQTKGPVEYLVVEHAEKPTEN